MFKPQLSACTVEQAQFLFIKSNKAEMHLQLFSTLNRFDLNAGKEIYKLTQASHTHTSIFEVCTYSFFVGEL